MKRFLHIIVNQQSRNSVRNFKDLILELPKYTNHYKIHQTKNLEQLTKLLTLLKEIINPEDIIIFVGGDGSLNQGVTLLEEYAIPNTIGYLPSGSGNDFARAHGISNNIAKSVAHFFRVKEARELAIIHVNQGTHNYYAVNSFGIGIDGLVNHMMTDQDKGAGSSTYLSSAIKAFKSFKPFPIHLKVDDGIYTYKEAQIALVTNNPYFGGGLKIVPQASSEDDILEVVIAEKATFKDLLIILSRLVLNKSHLKNKKIDLHQTKKLALFIDSSQYGQKDGEVFHQEGYALTFETKQRSFWL